MRVSKRDVARRELQAGLETLSCSPDPTHMSNKIQQLRDQLRNAQNDLNACLTKTEKEKSRKTWDDLSLQYKENKSEFSRLFKKYISKPHKPLPSSLVIQNQEIRSVDRIKTKWVERYSPSAPPAPSDQNKSFQARVLEKVKFFFQKHKLQRRVP